jgi:hypothetical protein
MKRLCNDKTAVERESEGVVHKMTGASGRRPHNSDLGKEQTKKQHMHLLMLHQSRGS